MLILYLGDNVTRHNRLWDAFVTASYIYISRTYDVNEEGEAVLFFRVHLYPSNYS